MAAAGKVGLEAIVAPDLPLVDIDPLRIRQVLANLIANALRYAPAGTAVTVEAVHVADRVAVSVSDAGPGIAPELLPHIFERFVRSDDSRGSGLGLAIAKRLVEAHQGSIGAERPSRGGTRITFELPIDRQV